MYFSLFHLKWFFSLFLFSFLFLSIFSFFFPLVFFRSPQPRGPLKRKARSTCSKWSYVNPVLRACVHVCMCTCVHVYMCACVHVCMCVCVHVCMCACVHVCMFTCLHVYMFTCLHVYMFTCLHVCRCACLHVCMFACLHCTCVHVCMQRQIKMVLDSYHFNGPLVIERTSCSTVGKEALVIWIRNTLFHRISIGHTMI